MPKTPIACLACLILGACASVPGHPYGSVDGGPVVSADRSAFPAASTSIGSEPRLATR